MSLTVSLGFDNLSTSRIPTKATFLRESAAFIVVVSHPDHLVDDIVHRFVNFVIFLQIHIASHFGMLE